jgi:hypothetical protein
LAWFESRFTYATYEEPENRQVAEDIFLRLGELFQRYTMGAERPKREPEDFGGWEAAVPGKGMSALRHLKYYFKLLFNV